MNCKDISKLITAYLDGEVTSEEHEQIQAHLPACQYCREELEALAATQNSLRQALKVTAAGTTPSPQAWAVIRQRLEAEEQPKVTSWGLAKSKVKGGIDTMIQRLVSPQPVWKPLLAGVLAVALIAGLTIVMPYLTRGQSPVALAGMIALHAPPVRAAFGEDAGTITVVQVTIRDGIGTVILTAEGADHFLAANVHLKERAVIEIHEIPVVGRLSFPELTEAEREWVIRIARTDHRVQEFLAQGAVVESVSPVQSISMGRTVDWRGRVTDETITMTVNTAALTMRLGEGMWVIMVDVEEEKVEGIDQLTVWEPPAIPIPRISEETQLKANDITRAHPLVQEFLDKGAMIMVTDYLRTVTWENGRAIISFPYGQDKVEVLITLNLGRGNLKDWYVVVNLAEERVESIEERVCRFDRDLREHITEERRIYP